MLRWRLTIGAALIAGLAGLCWLDAASERPGAWLVPLAVAVAALAAGEMRRLYGRRGVELAPSTAYVSGVLPVAIASVPVLMPELQFRLGLGNLGWLALGVTLALLDVFAGEMRRYESPGRSIARVAHAALAVAYVGGLVGMLIQLRIIMPPTRTMGWSGLFPLLSTIATVKLSDTCQYFVGRSVGRHKLSPRISPGKTWEGAIGGILIASLAAAYGMLQLGSGEFAELPRPIYAVAAWLYALTVGIAGLLGDLAESLLKRDAEVKDSSDWLPGFGGVLDLVDSLLFAGPVAYLWWQTGLLGV